MDGWMGMHSHEGWVFSLREFDLWVIDFDPPRSAFLLPVFQFHPCAPNWHSSCCPSFMRPTDRPLLTILVELSDWLVV
jgi:hypothetical protein